MADAPFNFKRKRGDLPATTSERSTESYNRRMRKATRKRKPRRQFEPRSGVKTRIA